MKDSNFAGFIFLSMLMMIPFTMYWSYFSVFLTDKGFSLLSGTMNWGQFVEMFLMLLVPVALAKLGIKKTMLMGLVALVVRYISFWIAGQADINFMVYVGILVHGAIFGFFIVGGQVYVDKKAPPEIKAQAQGLIALICFGVGMLIGNFFNGKLIDIYTSEELIEGVSTVQYNWNAIWMITTLISVGVLVAFLLFFKEDVTQPKAEAVEGA
jgi:MFS family permease